MVKQYMFDVKSHRVCKIATKIHFRSLLAYRDCARGQRQFARAGTEKARRTRATIEPFGISWQTRAGNRRRNPRTRNGPKAFALRNRNALAARAKYFRRLSGRAQTNRGNPPRWLVENR